MAHTESTSPIAEPATPQRPPSRISAVSTWLPWVALGVSALALGGSAALWIKLGQAQQELSRRSVETASSLGEARTLAKQAETAAQDLQARLGVAEVKLSEVTLQRSQLDELMLSVSRTRDESLVQDLAASLQLAQQQAQLTGSTQPMIAALQVADRRLTRSAQPRLNPAHRAVAHDLERVQAVAAVDVPALAARFDEVLRQIDALPLANGEPQRTQPAARSPSAAPVASTASSTPKAGETTSAWGHLGATWRDWAGRAWDAVTARGAELVRVHRIDATDAALLAPEQTYFLRENLKLKLLNARMALLAHQNEVARTDVATVNSQLARYFDAQAKATVQTREALEQLQRDLRQSVLPRLDESLAALAAAGAGR